MGHRYVCCTRCSIGVKKVVFALCKHKLTPFGVVVASVWRPKVLAYIICVCNVLCMFFFFFVDCAARGRVLDLFCASGGRKCGLEYGSPVLRVMKNGEA